MPIKSRFVAGATLACFLGVLPARALEWVSDRFEATLKPLQTQLQVAFGFRNTSGQAVSIRSVETNCDCLAAGADKRTYAPGEAGVVTARFTVGDRYGTYERAITVITEDGAEPRRLTVRLEVPEPATTSPTLLVWPLGSAPEEKTTDLRTAAGVAIDFTEAFSSSPDFTVRLEAVTAGRHYRLHVRPNRTNGVANAAIRAKGITPDGREIVASAYANVR